MSITPSEPVPVAGSLPPAMAPASVAGQTLQPSFSIGILPGQTMDVSSWVNTQVATAALELGALFPPPEIRMEGGTRVGKVLHVINGEHFSGAERVQQLLGFNLGRFGVESEFVCLKPKRFPQLSELDARRVALMPMRGRMDLGIVRKLTRKVLDGGFDLLHAHTPRTALITSAVAMRTGLPWCYHVHSPAERDSTRPVLNWINYWIEKLSLRNCDRLLTVSESLKQVMLRQGAKEEKIRVVPNGVPAIEPIDSLARGNASRWRLGLIALMRPRKGIEIALKAMDVLNRMQQPVELELIGSFETEAYQHHILQQIREMGLQDRVVWSGFTRDVPAALRRLDALLLPSLFGEGMPMVVLEALAAAVPVVATRVEGTPEVIRDCVEGVLAEPGNPDSLVDRIQYLTSDRQRWQQMSRAALHRHRTRFTDLAMAENAAKVYAEMLSCPASSMVAYAL